MASWFKPYTTRYQINGERLVEQREKKGYNQSGFAARCGWSPTYQWKLENDEIESVCEETIEIIKQVLFGTVI